MEDCLAEEMSDHSTKEVSESLVEKIVEGLVEDKQQDNHTILLSAH